MTIDIRLNRAFIDPVSSYPTGMPNEADRWRAELIGGALGDAVYSWSPIPGGTAGTPNLEADQALTLPTVRDTSGHRIVSFDRSSLIMDAGASMTGGRRSFLIVAGISPNAILGEGEQYVAFANTVNQPGTDSAGVLRWDASGSIAFAPWGSTETLTTATTYAPGDEFCAVVTVDSAGLPVLNVNGEVVTGATSASYTHFNRLNLGIAAARKLRGSIAEMSTTSDALTPTQMNNIWENMRAHYSFL